MNTAGKSYTLPDDLNKVLLNERISVSPTAEPRGNGADFYAFVFDRVQEGAVNAFGEGPSEAVAKVLQQLGIPVVLLIGPAGAEGGVATLVAVDVQQSILDIPEATLEQLGLGNANFGFPFKPMYCAMDDGIDCPGGCWHLFEDLPSFDPVTLSWQSAGNAWESGVDDSEYLEDTPEFQRWVKPGFSLVRIVEVASSEPRYHPLAYMARDV